MLKVIGIEKVAGPQIFSIINSHLQTGLWKVHGSASMYAYTNMP